MLLTDFGSTDYFVGSVKGVIVGISPHATIIDLTHDVAAFSIAEAAFALHSSYPYFPQGSIHIAVVDPGVGSGRRPLLLCAGGSYFLAPDNGLLSYVFHDVPHYQLIELTETEFHLSAPGNSFHARDVFAPVAARLAAGISVEHFGSEARDPVTIPLPVPHKIGDVLEGEVIYIDRFGNLITNITSGDIGVAGPRDRLTIGIGDTRCEIATCYADGSKGNPRALINSSGRVEIFIYLGNASDRLSAKLGSLVRVRRC